MRTTRLGFEAGFRVAFDVRQMQAAEMVIAPGGSEGGPDNRHRGADQWLYVVGGRGTAKVRDKGGTAHAIALSTGTLLVIEHGERHEIRNDGDEDLKTLNFYYPPAFDAQGNPIGPGKE